jgi:hypothetical protein
MSIIIGVIIAGRAGEHQSGYTARYNGDVASNRKHKRLRHVQEASMAFTIQRNVGMLLLAIWLILSGVAGMMPLGLPAPLMSVLALLAGVLILVGR